MPRHLARLLMLVLAAVQVSMGTPRTAGAILCFGEGCHQRADAAESICSAGCAQHDDTAGAAWIAHHADDCTCIDVEVPELRFRSIQRNAAITAAPAAVAVIRRTPLATVRTGRLAPRDAHEPPELAAVRTCRLLV